TTERTIRGVYVSHEINRSQAVVPSHCEEVQSQPASHRKDEAFPTRPPGISRNAVDLDVSRTEGVQVGRTGARTPAPGATIVSREAAEGKRAGAGEIEVYSGNRCGVPSIGIVQQNLRAAHQGHLDIDAECRGGQGAAARNSDGPVIPGTTTGTILGR